MHFSASVLVLCALLPAFGIAAPAAGSAVKSSTKSASETSSAKASSNKPAATNTISDTQIANAVVGWMNDTGKVTKFLNTATSLTGDEYTKQATIAYNAEVDELNHKAVLDAALGDQASVQAANDTLATKGTFQAVVDSLAAMVSEGPDTAQSRVTEINSNRCFNVLPNINMYFAAAGSPSASSFVPTGCLELSPSNASVVSPKATAASAQSSAPDAAISTAPDDTVSSSSVKGASSKKTTASRASVANATPTSKAGGASKASATSKVSAASKASATSKA
jgi:hypothetical protein